MRVCLLVLLFGISIPCFALDPQVVAANNNYYDILQRIEIIKDKSKSLLEREKEFSNFANEFGDPGPHWQTLKVGVLEIIIADAEFWSKQIIHFPAIQEKLLRDFEMDWYQDETSNYAEKLQLARVELKRELENNEKKKQSMQSLFNKLVKIKATTL